MGGCAAADLCAIMTVSLNSVRARVLRGPERTTMNNRLKNNAERVRAWVLLVLGIIYLALVMAMFAFGIDLAADKAMQYALHIAVILSAIAYVLFADAIYAAQEDKSDARPALLFAALFAVPVLAARGIGLAVISSDALFSPDSVFNFYAAASVSRAVEMTGWTVLFPLSMLFFSRMFFKARRKLLGWLCLVSAVCCFIAFLSFVSDNLAFLFIGVAGWGVLFLAVIVAYMAGPMKEAKA